MYCTSVHIHRTVPGYSRDQGIPATTAKSLSFDMHVKYVTDS